MRDFVIVMRPYHASRFTFHASLSQLHRLDHADPVTSVQSAGSEFADHLKYLIREAADVQNILALGGLRSSVRLHVYANQSSLRIALLERLPLAHRSRSAATRIHPRLVVGDEHDQI